MKQSAPTIDYQEVGIAQLEIIRPLWEELKAYHLPLSASLFARRAARTFNERKQELLAKSVAGPVRVDVAHTTGNHAPVAYCVTSIAPNGTGEIDSLFVEAEYRGKGIGTILTKRALAWLDGQNAVSKVVVVAFGNNPALEFYRKFGFVAENVSLRQTPAAGCGPNSGTSTGQPLGPEAP